jgi:uncharacterized membrane protein
MTNLIVPAVGLLIFYIGFILPKAKRNWFVGIRTPWTLSSDIVWEKTHKLGGILFKLVGAITIFGIFINEVAFYLTIFSAIGVSIFLFIYSYFIFCAENRKK